MPSSLERVASSRGVPVVARAWTSNTCQIVRSSEGAAKESELRELPGALAPGAGDTGLLTNANRKL